MEDQVCPRCKTTKYRNPSLKLMVNVCGHTLCENCVDLLFLKGSGSCPECNVPLRRSNFRVQLFENPMVEKEVDIRKRILRDYNKKVSDTLIRNCVLLTFNHLYHPQEEDFPSLDDYNDYLEEIESIIFNLMNNIDIIGTNKRIEQYKVSNRELILKNKSKVGREECELEELLEVEKQQEEERKRQLEELDKENKKKKLREKEALIDELMFSYENASSIVSVYANKLEQVREEAKIVPAVKPSSHFSTGIQFSRGAGPSGFLPVPKQEDGPLYVYKEPKMVNDGPPVPTTAEIVSKGYIQNVMQENLVERAGGYTSSYACHRAVLEALQGLYHCS